MSSFRGFWRRRIKIRRSSALKERMDRVVWNVHRDEWEAEWWEGGEKLLMGMNGLS